MDILLAHMAIYYWPPESSNLNKSLRYDNCNPMHGIAHVCGSKNSMTIYTFYVFLGMTLNFPTANSQ